MSDNNETLEYHEYFTPQQVSKMLGVTSRTIERWCKDGTMPAIKVGRRYRINKKFLAQWIEMSSTGWYPPTREELKRKRDSTRWREQQEQISLDAYTATLDKDESDEMKSED